jgi:hypothetical protein
MLTYAKKIVSQRSSPNAADRPFFRIHWDLQAYEVGYNGSKYLMCIKDQYTKLTYAFPLPGKDQKIVGSTVVTFERWVKRQLSLSIYKIRQDNEKAVIAFTEDIQTRF